MKSFRKKIVLITGGTRGIGLALALQLVEEDAVVIVSGRNQNKLDKLLEKYPNLNTHYLDVLEAASHEDIVRNIESEYGRLDILINNAAVLFSGDFIEQHYPNQQIELEVSTNLTSPIQLTQSLLPLLLQSDAGLVLNITSAVANLPMRSLPVYSATKAALHSFTISLRASLSNSTVRVIEAQPPLVATDMTANLTSNAKNMKMITPERCALEIIKGIKSGKQQILIGKSTKGLYWGSRFAPAMVLKQLNDY